MMGFRKTGYAVLPEDHQAHSEEGERGALNGNNHVGIQQVYAREGGTIG
jgi:hypothetical protein